MSEHLDTLAQRVGYEALEWMLCIERVERHPPSSTYGREMRLMENKAHARFDVALEELMAAHAQSQRGQGVV